MGTEIELHTSNSIQIVFKCVCVYRLPMSCQFAISGLKLDGLQLRCFQAVPYMPDFEVSSEMQVNRIWGSGVWFFPCQILPFSSALTFSWVQISCFISLRQTFFLHESQPGVDYNYLQAEKHQQQVFTCLSSPK